MHPRTPHLTGWSLRTLDGEYVTDVSSISTLFAKFANGGEPVFLCGETITNAEEEDSHQVMTSVIIRAKILRVGKIWFITDQMQEYIASLADLDQKWREELSKITQEEVPPVKNQRHPKLAENVFRDNNTIIPIRRGAAKKIT